MKFHIENLGKIVKTEIDVNDLTVICGPNSSNKTWIAYSIFHNLYFKHDETPNLLSSGIDKRELISGEFPTYTLDTSSPKFKILFDKLFDAYIKVSNHTLSETFNTYREVFKGTSITTDIDHHLKETIFTSILSDEFDEELVTVWEDVHVSSPENTSEYQITFIDEDTEEDEDELDEAICEIICQFIWRVSPDIRPFVITSERVGSLVFQKDIDGATIKISDELNTLLEKNRDNKDIRKVVRRLHQSTLGTRATLSTPVRKNLDAVRNAENELKKVSFLKEKHPSISDALNKIVKGKFEVENSVLTFKSDDDKYELPITVASSSIKSLFIIDLYVNSLAKENDLLIIDEPELNLHPDNQRLIARVIARIANAGIKVIITTHSDYLLRELNNCIMLSGRFENKQDLMHKYNFKNEDILLKSQVNAYTVEQDGTVSSMAVNDDGIDTKIFDNIIIDSNESQNEIYEELI